MTYTKEKTYSIGDAAEMIGVTQRQLRNWEEQDYISKLDRIICGDRHYRRFSLKDIELARVIKKYLDEGFTLPVAAEKAKSEIERGTKYDS
jgi:DNA-binding transcriptional MerR regulator